MNTKENGPKDTKEAEKRIEAKRAGEIKNTAPNKNYQSKSKNDKSTKL